MWWKGGCSRCKDNASRESGRERGRGSLTFLMPAMSAWRASSATCCTSHCTKPAAGGRQAGSDRASAAAWGRSRVGETRPHTAPTPSSSRGEAPQWQTFIEDCSRSAARTVPLPCAAAGRTVLQQTAEARCAPSPEYNQRCTPAPPRSTNPRNSLPPAPPTDAGQQGRLPAAHRDTQQQLLVAGAGKARVLQHEQGPEGEGSW